jgi:peptidoglycan/xylan/chitin deacetylase (PgdA/CDA1 family)
MLRSFFDQGRASLKFSATLHGIMFRRSFSSILPVALAILSTALASAQQGTPSNPPATSPAPTLAPLTNASTNALATTTASNNPTAISTTAPAIVSAGMQAPVQQAPGTERSSFCSIHVDGPYIAMTFDDGPDARLTPRLLDILKERHIHATFFVLGQRVQDHPEILQREIAEGHEVGNHSWDHKALNKLAEGGLQHELADTSDLIKQTIGKPVTLMRPPYGATNPRLSRAIEKEYGMKVILWSVDPDDWKDPGASVVSSRILNGWKQSGGTKPGAIILSHDIHKGTIEAMPATLDALLAKGYKFVTISELLALESKNPAPTPSASPSSSPSAQKSSKSKKRQS